MKIRPIVDRIVIKVIEDTAQTEGGIFIPDSAKEKPQKGEVVAVGEGKTLDSGEKAPVSVKVGETVIYEKYALLEKTSHTDIYMVFFGVWIGISFLYLQSLRKPQPHGGGGLSVPILGQQNYETYERKARNR